MKIRINGQLVTTKDEIIGKLESLVGNINENEFIDFMDMLKETKDIFFKNIWIHVELEFEREDFEKKDKIKKLNKEKNLSMK